MKKTKSKIKKYIYKLKPEDFYQFLVDHERGVEVLSEGEAFVEFALYEPIKDLEPLMIMEVEVIPPERAFRPIKIRELMLLPSWLKPILVRPGSAFGTGLHPTTRLCLDLIQDFLKGGWSVLDVGTGTGILAIACKRLGAGRVLAIDVDPQAVEECLHNREENGVDIECLRAEPKDIREGFDLLVANLELKIFERELPKLLGLFQKAAIFSGIYGKEELKSFLDLLDKELVRIKKLKSWYAIVVKG
ncbi:MAG: 50S ribosomal protein L11 methyltransferase [Aquificaceae bacterium]